MYNLSENAEGYLENFKKEMEKFKTVTEKSIPIAEECADDKFMNRLHKEQLEESDIIYWRMLTKLDTIKNLIILSDEEYDSLEKMLNSALSNVCILNKIINKEK